MHPSNYEQSNPLVTPLHIVPEWYFLPFYTILRVAPGKISGIILMGFSIIVLFFLPFFIKRNLIKLNFYKRDFFFWTFICNFLILGYLGSCPTEPIYILFGRISAFFYYFFFNWFFFFFFYFFFFFIFFYFYFFILYIYFFFL
jgi:quinol-cytochrome oxidoreductase complex cytochrome b subunit